MRNSALAGQLAALYFPAHPLAGLPCVVSACAHTLLGTAAALLFREQAEGGSATSTEPVAALPPPADRGSDSSSSFGGGGGGGGGGGPGLPPGPPGPDLTALLAATAQRLQPLVAAAGAGLEAARGAVALATRGGVEATRSALMEAAGTLVPDLGAEVEGQLAELAGARLDPEPEAEQGAPPRKAPANPLAQSVVMVGAECAPWSKTGARGAWLAACLRMSGSFSGAGTRAGRRAPKASCCCRVS